MSDPIHGLRQRMAELTDLHHAAALLEWDQQTMMPPAGAGARAETLATLHRLSHDRLVAPDTGSLIDAAEQALNGSGPDGDEARMVRVARRRFEKASRVPSELAGEMARAASLGQEAWTKARAASDFSAFAPHLERNIELARRYVDCFDGFACPYDALLDDYDPQMTTAEVSTLFDQLKGELVPLIATLSERELDDSCLHGRFPIDGQRALVADVVAMMGFNPERWRLDDAVHPFASSFGSHDVRITSRWDETFFASGLYGAMHETGHGLYEAGIADELQRTPLGSADSLSIHESQSRMWENMVGRGRPFCGVLAPLLAARFGAARDLTADALYRAVNRVHPSYIRVEADEATYGLHIVLRFELEQELIEGRLSVAELPEQWNSRFERYFGLEVNDDALGVLQDVHWSAGLIGYFPTYALGNLIAGQLWQRARTDIPDLDAQLGAGNLAGLREWLREHVHRHGAKYTTRELLERVVGSPIAVEPFVSYLKGKLSDVYGVELA